MHDIKRFGNNRSVPKLPCPRAALPRHATFLVVAVMSLAVIGLYLASLQGSYAHNFADINEKTHNIATGLAANLRGSLAMTDRILANTADQIRDLGGADAAAADPSFTKSLANQIHALTQIRSFSVVNAAGLRVITALTDAPPIAIRDCPSFTQQRDRPDLGLSVAGLTMEPNAQEPNIALSRRLTDAAGRFQGVVIATLDLGYFDALSAQLITGKTGAIAVIDQNDTIVSRFPPEPGAVGTRLTQAQVTDDSDPKAITGDVTRRGLFDGVMRHYSFIRLKDFNLTVTAGLGLDEGMAGWRRDALNQSLVMTLLLLGFLLLALRIDRHRRRSSAALDLADQTARDYQLLAESTTDLIARIDAENCYRQVNSAAIPLYGVPPSALIGHSCLDGIHPEDLPEITNLLQRIRAGHHSGRVQYRKQRADGREIWIEAGFRRISATDIAKSARSIDDQKAAEATARAALATAEQALATAKHANESKSTFLASMSHELRSPLSAVMGYAELLLLPQAETLTPRQRERIERVLRGGQSLLTLITDVLDFSKVEIGNLRVSIEPVALAPVRDALHQTLLPQAAAAGITLIETPAAADTLIVLADHARLLQILINFGSNAIKYNHPGGQVESFTEIARNGRIRIGITDTGRGIPLAKQAGLFEPFNRLGAEYSPIEGTGIGLALCRQLSNLIGGTIGYRSVEGQGSSFWIDLPPGSKPASSPPPPNPPPPFCAATRLLYIDDNPDALSVMRDFTAGLSGITLATANTARLGRSLALSFRPDLILLDLHLPDGTGFQLLSDLRQHPETARTPIIALSADALPATIDRARQAGFDDYLTKPIPFDRVSQLLRHPPLHRAGGATPA